MSEVADFVVIGAGTAGCLMANRLSADPRHSVILLESGSTDVRRWRRAPIGSLYGYQPPNTAWNYHTLAQPGLNGRALPYVQGKALGGSSALGGVIHMRGQAADYDKWAEQTGDQDWSWAACLADFKRHEDHYAYDGDTPPDVKTRRLHARGGGWRVEPQQPGWDILNAYAAAARQYGVPATANFNQGNGTGTGYFDVSRRAGQRWDSYRAFLRRILHRKSLEVWDNVTVEKLLFETDAGGQPRCNAVELCIQGVRGTVAARKEVILCAGAIGSPHLLQRSGLGDPAHLRRIGVDLVRDLPGVGQNMQDHLQVRTVLRLRNAKTLNQRARTRWGRFRVAAQYALTRSGPMAMAPAQLGIITKSDPAQARANIQFQVQPLSQPHADYTKSDGALDDFAALTAGVANLAPSSRGAVRARSASAYEAPEITPNYLSTEADRQVALQSLKVARAIGTQPALRPFAPQEHRPGVAQAGEDAQLRAVADSARSMFHACGTARMGRADDPAAVVDSRLRVRGIRGLRVVDASVMPTITSGNTNGPTLMISEKAAGWILQDWKRRN